MLLFKKRIYLAVPDLTCGTCDFHFHCSMLVLQLWHVGSTGIEPGPPELGAQSLSPWATREVPSKEYLKLTSNTSVKRGAARHHAPVTSKMKPAGPREDGRAVMWHALVRGVVFRQCTWASSKTVCSRGSASRCGYSAESVRL